MSTEFAFELELWIVDLITRKPVSHAKKPDGKRAFANEAFVAWVVYLCKLGDLPLEVCTCEHFTTEMFGCVVELTTHKVSSAEEMWRKMRPLHTAAMMVAEKMGVGLIGGGTHPFANGLTLPILPKPAYQVQVKRWGPLLLYAAATTGLHVHVSREGLEDEERNRWVINIMRVFIPMLIAVSENTPFAHGAIAGPRDYRHTMFSAYGSPMTGFPEPMSAPQFETFRHALIGAGLMDTNRFKLWNYVLAHPFYPTFEVRSTSTPLSWEFAGHITVLLAALVTKIARADLQVQVELSNEAGVFDLGRAAEIPNWALEVQTQQILGQGLNTVLEEDFFTGQPNMLVKDSVRVLLAWLYEDADLRASFSLERTVRFFEAILRDGTQVDQQLRFYEENGCNDGAVRKLITDFLIPEMRKPF